MNRQIFWTIIIVLCAGLIFGLVYYSNHKTASQNPLPTQTNQTTNQTVQTPPPQVVPPIDRASERVTKKPFGIYITPKTSPVQPERFTGFHTGTDFETFPEEANSDMPFYAICAGQILQKRTASGYGGVLVQSCTINNEPVTVIYGHIRTNGTIKNIGDSLAQGEKIGFLGQPPTETDGERKHLHLGIHKGTAINIAGYVQNQADLSAWLDFQKL